MRFPSASALRVFDAAARLGSFKKAASQLGVSATAVSHQIRSLEGQLGLALFVRETRKVELTEDGERLARATGPAFHSITQALEELAGGAQVLEISTTPAFAGLWLIPRLKAFESGHRGIQVHVDTSHHPVNLERSRHIDLAIRYGSVERSEGDAAFAIRETFGVFASPGLIESGADLNRFDRLETRWRSKTLPQISWPDWLSCQQQLTENGREIRRFDEEQHVVAAALAGQGLALVSAFLVQDHVERGWLVPVLPEIRIPGLRYTIERSPGAGDTPKVRRFVAWLRDQLEGDH